MRHLKGADSGGLSGLLSIKSYKDGVLVRETGPFRNKVVSSTGYGRNLILRAMTGDTTFPIVINSAAIGDDATAAADGDTDLGNPLVTGFPITNFSVTNNVMSVDVFVPDANLTNDTYAEFGFFASGRIISRVIISPAYTKASGEDTLFSYTLTFNG